MSDFSNTFKRFDEKQLLQQLLRSTPDHVYFKDTEGRFLLVNRSLASKHGFKTPDEAVGKTDFDCFSEEHAQKAFDDEKRIMETGEPLIGIVEKETWPDGHVTWVSTTKEPLRDDKGNIVGTFGISRDITEQHLAQEQAAQYADELKDINEHTQADLVLAGELQGALLPTEYPLFPDDCAAENSAIRFNHVYTPAGTVGGDILCIEKVSDTAVGVLICDSIGHGVRAAVLSAMVLSLFHELEQHHGAPGHFMERLNRRMRKLMSACPDVIFATACYMVIDHQENTIVCANAGHPSPILLDTDAGKSSFLQPSVSQMGPALGLNQDAAYPETKRDCAPGSRILMVTDGITEAGISADGEFGEERLAECIEEHAASDAKTMLEEVLADLDTFLGGGSPHDDVCAVCIELTARS